MQLSESQAPESLEGRRRGVALFRPPSLLPRQERGPPSPPPTVWGVGLVVAGSLIFLTFLYACIVSKLLPSSGIYLLDLLRDDWYYCLLIPLTLPTMMVAVYLHWLSMKLFKHA